MMRHSQKPRIVPSFKKWQSKVLLLVRQLLFRHMNFSSRDERMETNMKQNLRQSVLVSVTFFALKVLKRKTSLLLISHGGKAAFETSPQDRRMLENQALRRLQRAPTTHSNKQCWIGIHPHFRSSNISLPILHGESSPTVFYVVNTELKHPSQHIYIQNDISLSKSRRKSERYYIFIASMLTSSMIYQEKNTMSLRVRETMWEFYYEIQTRISQAMLSIERAKTTILEHLSILNIFFNRSRSWRKADDS